ncbi:hypothetical protein ASG21_13840 [Chryseobacterium sp. Leaf394]|nr:hypothetical protein ASG21_13840 [Chryseobacterium sp. Leaf394]
MAVSISTDGSFKLRSESLAFFKFLFHKCKILKSRKKSKLLKVFKIFRTIHHSLINTIFFFLIKKE